MRAGHRGTVTRIIRQVYENIEAPDGPNPSRLHQQKLSLAEKSEVLSRLDNEILELTESAFLEDEVMHADEVKERLSLAIIDIEGVLYPALSFSEMPSDTSSEAGTLRSSRSSSVASQHELSTVVETRPPHTSNSHHDLSAAVDAGVRRPSLSPYNSSTAVDARPPHTSISHHDSSTAVDARLPHTSISHHDSSTAVDARLPRTSISHHDSSTAVDARLPRTSISHHDSSTAVDARLPRTSYSSAGRMYPAHHDSTTVGGGPPRISFSQHPPAVAETFPTYHSHHSVPAVNTGHSHTYLPPHNLSAAVEAEPPRNSTALHEPSAATLAEPRHIACVKLPKLSIKRFNGDTTKWMTFWDSFDSAIHSNPDLSSVDKFNYLNSFLESNAAEAIAGLTLTAANYTEAVATLKKRFGNSQLIVNKHMEGLLALSTVTSHNDVKSLRRLYDSVEAHVRRLKALGVPAASYGGQF